MLWPSLLSCCSISESDIITRHFAPTLSVMGVELMIRAKQRGMTKGEGRTEDGEGGRSHDEGGREGKGEEKQTFSNRAFVVAHM